MRALLLGLLVTIFAVSLFATDSGSYLIRIDSPTPALMASLANDDIASVRPSEYVDVIVSGERLAELNTRNHNVQVLRTSEQARTDAQRDLAGYRSYDDLVSELQTLAEGFPEIVQLYDLGDTWGTTYSNAGNTNYTPHDLWAVKISDNPSVEEDEPCVFYVATHHAREPISTEVCMQVLYTFIEGWQSDPTITADIQNKQIWFMPLVNPDGFERVYDGEDVWWRKNVRDNNDNGEFDSDHGQSGSGDDGVDLNRNYGFTWGDVGASDDPNSVTYHGPTEFSEPETQVLRDLILAHHFVAGIGYHSYGEELLIPYGNSNGIVAPDDAALYDLGYEMALAIPKLQNGHYTPEYSWALYPTSGGLDDWAYGTQGAFCYTIELGTQFIPAANDVPTICEDNINAALLLAHRLDRACLCGHITDASTGNPVRAEVFVDGIDNTGAPRDPMYSEARFGRYDRLLMPGTYTVHFRASGYLEYSTDVVITDDAQTIHDVSLIPSAYSTTITGYVVKPDGTPATSGTVSIEGMTVQSAISPDGSFTITEVALGQHHLHAIADDMGMIERTITVLPENADYILRFDAALYSDDFESGDDSWTTGGSWGIATSQSHSGSQSLAESPAGNYNNNLSINCQFGQTINLTSVRSASVGFFLHYDIEDGYDYLALQARVGGSDWTNLDVFSGTDTSWQYRAYSLNDYCGQSSVLLRFRFVSDSGVNRDGAYIDNFGVFTNAPFSGLVYGDANLDGAVTRDDMVATMQYAAGLDDANLTGPALIRTDVDGNGQVTAFDAALIAQVVAGTADSFPIEQANYTAPQGTVNWFGESGSYSASAEGTVYAYSLSATSAQAAWFVNPLLNADSLAYIAYRIGSDRFTVAVCSPIPLSDNFLNLTINNNSPFESFTVFNTINAEASTSSFEVTTDTDDEVSAPALLYGNYPNPFNPETTITYSLGVAGYVALDVFNLRGQKVKTLTEGLQTAGSHSVVWNGTDDRNHSVSSGVYLYRLHTAKGSVLRKMLLVK